MMVSIYKYLPKRRDHLKLDSILSTLSRSRELYYVEIFLHLKKREKNKQENIDENNNSSIFFMLKIYWHSLLC